MEKVLVLNNATIGSSYITKLPIADATVNVTIEEEEMNMNSEARPMNFEYGDWEQRERRVTIDKTN